MPSLPLLICMMGLPRSGKTTIVKELAKEHRAPIVRRDDIRLALHGHRYIGLAEPFVKAISDVMIRSLFYSGHEVVICDETNYSRAARDYHKGPSWRTVFYEVPTTPEVCKERAVATGQPDLVPVIEEMWRRREPLGEDEEKYPWFVEYYKEGKLVKTRDLQHITPIYEIVNEDLSSDIYWIDTIDEVTKFVKAVYANKKPARN